MGNVKVVLRRTRKESIKEIKEALKRELQSQASELVSENFRELGEASVALLSFERIYFRNGSYASLTVMLTEHGEEQTADVIGFGGGEGLFNISLGANKDFAKMAVKVLESYGFAEEWRK